MLVSTYKNFSKKLGNKPLLDILQEIKSNKFESEINSIRHAINSGRTDQADKLKSELFAFTTSGTFDKQRKSEFLDSYSQIINLDFDHIPTVDLERVVKKIN